MVQGGFPTVIAKSRTVTLGGERFGRELLTVEMNTQSIADIRAYIRSTVIEQTTQQIALGNPPQAMEVDGQASKPLDDVNKKVVVLFGTVLAASAMRELELELANAIAQATTPHTGRLGNVAASWAWLFIPKGGAARQVSAANPPAAFAFGDRLVLVPKNVSYASMVNATVAGGGRLNALNKVSKRGKRWLAHAMARQNRGFLYWAAERTRRRAAFKQFSVSVVFSTAHMVEGELRTRSGTGMIVIRARNTRRRIV